MHLFLSVKKHWGEIGFLKLNKKQQLNSRNYRAKISASLKMLYITRSKALFACGAFGKNRLFFLLLFLLAKQKKK